MSGASVAIHRFRNRAAVATLGTAGTVYLDATAARALAEGMAELAASLEREAFADSPCLNLTVEGDSA